MGESLEKAQLAKQEAIIADAFEEGGKPVLAQLLRQAIPFNKEESLISIPLYEGKTQHSDNFYTINYEDNEGTRVMHDGRKFQINDFLHPLVEAAVKRRKHFAHISTPSPHKGLPVLHLILNRDNNNFSYIKHDFNSKEEADNIKRELEREGILFPIND